MAMESGQQEVAREELRIIRELSPDVVDADTDLVLRKPHLAQVEADLDSARADLERARLDLSRTVLRAPFDCLVTQRNVNLGSYVNSQEVLGTLVGVKEYWIEAAVPLDRLKLLDLNQPGGAPARVLSQTGEGRWSGRALRLTGALTEQTRMARVLVTVQDPLGLDSNATSDPLVLGDYVAAVIQGRKLADVFALPRSALRPGDVVWTAEDGRLAMKPVRTAWKDDARIYVAEGLAPGDMVIVSDIPAPVPGMAVEAIKSGAGDTPDGDAAP